MPVDNIHVPKINKTYYLDDSIVGSLKNLVDNTVATSTGALIFVPTGSHYFDGSLFWKSYTSLVGVNPRLSKIVPIITSSTASAIVSTLSAGTDKYILFRDLTFDGSSSQCTSVYGAAISSSWGWNEEYDRLYFTRWKGGCLALDANPNGQALVLISDCAFKGNCLITSSADIYAYVPRVTTVENCRFETHSNTNTKFIYLYGGWRSTIRNNYFYKNSFGLVQDGGARSSFINNYFAECNEPFDIGTGQFHTIFNNSGNANSYAIVFTELSYSNMYHNCFLNSANHATYSGFFAYGSTLIGSRFYANVCTDVSGNNVPWHSNAGGIPTDALYMEEIMGGGEEAAGKNSLHGKVSKIREKTDAGAPSDAVYGSASGNMVFNSNENKIYVRGNSSWKAVTVA